MRLIGILEKDIELTKKHTTSSFSMFLWDETYQKRREAGERLIELIAEFAFIREEKLIGKYRGFELYLANDATGARRVFLLKGNGSYQSDISESAMGIVARLDNVINGLVTRCEGAKEALAGLDREETELTTEAEKPFPFEQELEELKQKLRDVNRQLGMN